MGSCFLGEYCLCVKVMLRRPTQQFPEEHYAGLRRPVRPHRGARCHSLLRAFAVLQVLISTFHLKVLVLE